MLVVPYNEASASLQVTAHIQCCLAPSSLFCLGSSSPLPSVPLLPWLLLSPPSLCCLGSSSPLRPSAALAPPLPSVPLLPWLLLPPPTQAVKDVCKSISGRFWDRVTRWVAYGEGYGEDMV
ncbi:unnamed protein product, partial [Closterium sp. NIES-53]